MADIDWFEVWILAMVVAFFAIGISDFHQVSVSAAIGWAIFGTVLVALHRFQLARSAASPERPS